CPESPPSKTQTWSTPGGSRKVQAAPSGRRDAHDQRIDRDGRVVRSGHAVESGDPSVVVRYPEGAAWTFRDPPGVDQVWVLDGGDSGQVGHEVGLHDNSRRQAAAFECLQM